MNVASETCLICDRPIPPGVFQAIGRCIDHLPKYEVPTDHFLVPEDVAWDFIEATKPRDGHDDGAAGRP